MRNLIVFIVLLTLLAPVFGQDVLSSEDLPKIVKNDTVIIYGEVWVQSSRSEVHQRAEKKGCEKKLKRVHGLLSQKHGLESSLDSTLLVIEDLEEQIDSLNSRAMDTVLVESGNCQAKLDEINQKLTDSRYQEWIYRNKIKKIRKRIRILYLISIAEAVVIVLLI